MARLVWRPEGPTGHFQPKDSVRLVSLDLRLPTLWGAGGRGVQDQAWAPRKLTSALGKALFLPGRSWNILGQTRALLLSQLLWS